MMYHLFLNLLGKVAKKDKTSDQNPRGAKIKFPQCISYFVSSCKLDLTFFAACGPGEGVDTTEGSDTRGQCVGKSFDISDRNNFEPLTSLNRSLRKNTMSPFKFSAVTVVEFLGGAGEN